MTYLSTLDLLGYTELQNLFTLKQHQFPTWNPETEHLRSLLSCSLHLDVSQHYSLAANMVLNVRAAHSIFWNYSCRWILKTKEKPSQTDEWSRNMGQHAHTEPNPCLWLSNHLHGAPHRSLVHNCLSWKNLVSRAVSHSPVRVLDGEVTDETRVPTSLLQFDDEHMKAHCRIRATSVL